ncbi:MAG: hypothetical protein C0518_11860 [Opitutus sp.]|nr:hypothetical protein [Opitutus sp.]
MKNKAKLLTLGTSALFAAVLCAQAQSSSSPTQSTPPTTTPPPVRSDDTSIRYSSDPKSQSKSQSDVQATQSSPDTLGTNRTATTSDTSTSGANAQSSSNLSSSSTSYGTQSALTASAQTDTQVTTIVQQIDQQGPAVVQRVVTQFSDVACSEENARKLIEALHSGTEVTLTGDDGQTVSFTPTSTLGYGEAYIALALAAETLKQNGITGCATPDQWRSVLIGGPLTGATSVSSTTTVGSSASASSNFPGILVLKQQGQGWGQIAQTTNVQIGTVVSSARSSLNLSESSSSALGSSSSEMDKNSSSSSTTSGADKKDKKDYDKKATDPKSDSSSTLGSSSSSSGASSYSTDKSDGRNPNAYEKSKNAQDKSANSDYRSTNASDKSKVNDSTYKWKDPADPKAKDKKDKKDKKDDEEDRDDPKE